MSRIGKLPIDIPSGVTITVDDGVITVAGSKGTLSQPTLRNVTVHNEEGSVSVTRNQEDQTAQAEQGLLRSLIFNMVHGVTQGFQKQLEVNGVGFRVSGGGQDIEMSLGFSHPARYHAGEGIDLSVAKNIITVSGISKQQVGQTAADIRALRKPEPYKGKGIKYVGEQIIRKAGKAGAK